MNPLNTNSVSISSQKRFSSQNKKQKQKMLYTSSLSKKSISGSNSNKPSTRPKPGSHEASQQLWTSVALQQHMLRQMSEQGRAPTELRPPRPLPEGRLSLAQKMGLVERPPDAPNDDEWTQVEDQSAVRGDLSRPCAICCMHFSSSSSSSVSAVSSSTTTFKVVGNGASALLSMKSEQPVILSCSHCFHAGCLRQLEKHAKQKQQTRRCPICRAEGYFRRQFTAAPAILQTLAVTKIQSFFRGYLTRRLYIKLKLKIDPTFRSEYYYKKLKQMTEMQMAEHAAHEAEVDQTLDEIDYVMEISTVSRFREQEEWIDVVRRGALARDHADCPVCLNSVFGDDDQDHMKINSHESSIGPFIESWDELEVQTVVEEKFLMIKQKQSSLQDALHHQQQGRSTMSLREQMLMKKHYGEQETVLAPPSSAVRAVASNGRRSNNNNRSNSIKTTSTRTTSSMSKAKQNQKQKQKDREETEQNERQKREKEHQLSASEFDKLKSKLLRSVVLTSCGHLYHAACLRSMEKFCFVGGGSSIKPKCANCRKGYLKRFLVFNVVNENRNV